MKAAYYKGNQTVEVGPATPRDPEPGEVRIEVAYCGVCGTDLHIFQGHMDHAAGSYQGDISPRPFDVGHTKGDGVFFGRHNSFEAEHHLIFKNGYRIIIPNGRFHQPLSVIGCRGYDHFEARNMAKPGVQ